MLKNSTELDLFQTVIQRLTFTYCITLSDLYDLTYQGRVMNDSEYVYSYLPNEERVNHTKRYGRILQRLCCKEHVDNSAKFLVNQEKIYDGFLLEHQKELYNEVAELVGYIPIGEMLSIPLMKEALSRDNGNLNYETIVKYYPYYHDEERNGFSFIEFILLINIYSTVQKRGLYTLNKSALSEKDKEIAEKMIDKINQNIKKKEMFALYVHAFFDILESVKNGMHNKLAEECIREAWIPERLKGRKDIFRAFNTHQKDKTNINIKVYEESQIDNIMESGDKEAAKKMIDTMFEYSTIDYIGNDILPIVFKILIEDFDSVKIIKNSEDILLAEEYADIIRTYINKAIEEVTNILNKLYIEE